MLQNDFSFGSVWGRGFLIISKDIGYQSLIYIFGILLPITLQIQTRVHYTK